MSKLFCGIDPGVTGAIACIDDELKVKRIETYPGDPLALYDVLKQIYEEQEVTYTCFEMVNSAPGNAGAAMFTFGRNVGEWLMALAILGARHELVTARKWRNAVMDSKRRGDTKKLCLAHARRLFPEAGINWSASDHNKADALLLALYAKMKWSRM